MIWKEISQMANCQNNMRYGRQMNNNNCRSMPNGNNNCRPAPAPMPRTDRRQCGSTEPCGCRAPEPRKPEPCGCRTPERRPSQPCGCRYDALEDFPIAMAYVPWQKWRNLYEPCKGFQRGTIFEDLSKPFHGRGGCNR